MNPLGNLEKEDRKTHKVRTETLDPRTKFYVLVVSFVLLLLVWDILYLSAIALLILLYGFLMGAMKIITKFWVIPTVVALFSIIVWSLYPRGETILFWVVSTESIEYGVATAIKLDSMIFSGLFYFFVVSPDEMAAGFLKMGVPHKVGFSFTYAMRLFPMIMEQAKEIARIQQSRGLDLKSGGPISRFKKYIPLLTPIFLTTIRNTNNLAIALESRGFGLERKRHGYLDLRLSALDFATITISTLFLFLFIALRIMGYGGFSGTVSGLGNF